jgi:SAM-dependent methyltransferase
MQEEKLVETELVAAPREYSDSDHAWEAVLKHRRIPFISYAYEWSFSMLRDAAVLQLELIAAAIEEDMILKDASPYNVQWLGTQPVFIDIPSFVRHVPGKPWVAYRQFCQLFLYPLFLEAYKNVSYIPWLRGSIEGIEPAECSSLMSLRDLLRPGVFMHVFLHARLQGRFGATERDIEADMRRAGFHRELILSNVRKLLKIVRGLKWRPAKSVWADYTQDNSYSEHDSRQKQEFVRGVVQSRRWTLVWDLGANTGSYARIAAENADYVVALDRDTLCVERMYNELKQEGNRKILPLVGNLVDPSVNRGWRGLERQAFTNRSKPDLTLCLALIHHLIIGGNIPLRDFVEWLATLRTNVVIEFVTRDDPMVKAMLRFRDEQFAEYNLGNFERCIADSYEVLRREPLSSGTRILFYLKPRNAP